MEKLPVEMPYGRFVWEIAYWKLEGPVRIVVGDVAGQPDPAFLRFVPGILTEIDALEAAARSIQAPPLSRGYVRQFVASSDARDVDYVIAFRDEENDWDLTVSMRDGKPVRLVAHD